MKDGITTGQERLAKNNIDAMERQAKRPDVELKASVKDDRQVHEVRQRERGGVRKARLGGLRKGMPNEAVCVSERVTDSIEPGARVQQSAHHQRSEHTQRRCARVALSDVGSAGAAAPGTEAGDSRLKGTDWN